MTRYIKKEDAVAILKQRDKELAGIYGDLGGAASGAAKLVGSLPSYDFAEEVEHLIYEWENRHCNFIGWIGSHALRSFLEMVREIDHE